MDTQWTKLATDFASEQQAQQRAQIVAATESRLSNLPGGPQYDIETKVENNQGQWHVFWRKIFVGFPSGCGQGCGSCKQQPTPPAAGGAKGQVIPFKRPTKK